MVFPFGYAFIVCRFEEKQSSIHNQIVVCDTVASERAELEKEIFASIAKRSTHLLRIIKKAL